MLALLWQVQGTKSQPDTGSFDMTQEVVLPAVVKNPLPGFVGRVFQWAFNLPQWLQWSAIAIGVLVGVAIMLTLIVKRDAIFDWIASQSRGYKMALAGLAGVMLIGAGGVGYAGNHYTQHNNDFCIGCHVMGDAWGAFQKSEHRKLQCHNCHQQSMIASMSQLYFWVAERPQEIPKHSKVPTRICSSCHIQTLADSGWKRISATAGHRLHLKSDSSALKHVECVTCHGQEVHRFKPVDKTCGQTGCHKGAETKITLGAMAGQTTQHCTGCHTFTRAVAEDISMDSTRKFLVANGSPQSCFRCHEMKEKIKNITPERDPGHKAVCGTCHNPHKQTSSKDAFQTCASGSCHQDLATRSPFHGPKSPHKVKDCAACHTAHEWKPMGKECADCHKGVFNSKPSPPAPPGAASGSGPVDAASAPIPSPLTLRPVVDTVPRAERWTATASGHRRRVPRARAVYMGARVHMNARSSARTNAIVGAPVRLRAVRFQQPTKSRIVVPKPLAIRETAEFSHKIHKVLACGGCHDQSVGTGAVNVRNKADCAACHHSSDRSVSCQGCHGQKDAQTKAFAKSVAMRVNGAAPARTRTLTFAHNLHTSLDCKSCHTNGVLLGVTRDCLSCHTDHHNAERNCVACHAPEKSVHQRTAHDGCAGSTCHTNATVVALAPTRQVCLTCHREQVTHKPKRECAECHATSWGAAAAAPR